MHGSTNTAKTAVDTVVVTFKNPCITQGKVSVTPPAGANNGQTFPAENRYAGATSTYTVTEYTITPSICPITYTCKSVSPLTSSKITCPANFSTAKSITATLEDSDYTGQLTAPGTYVFTIGVVTGDGSTSVDFSDFTVNFVVADVCDPPTV